MYREIGKLGFKKDNLFMVIFQEDLDGPSEFIALFESEEEAKILCSVLAERDEKDDNDYIVLPITSYETHEDYLDDEEIEI